MDMVGRETRERLVRELRKGKRSHLRKGHLGVTVMWPCSNLREKRGFGEVSSAKE